MVSKKSFVRLKVKVEFRKDLTVSDLPSTSETLNLSFKVNYIQSDDSSENTTIDNNGKLIKIVSGDYDTVGSEIFIGEECFYVISSDEDSVTMLTKYNLFVGNECTLSNFYSCIPYGDEATGIQDSTMISFSSGESVRNGSTIFSSTPYWISLISVYPAYVYDSNSILYNYVENYRTYLESQGVKIEEARLIKMEELEKLGCNKSDNSCIETPSWVIGTSYWTGVGFDNVSRIWGVRSDGTFRGNVYTGDDDYGVRPVIVVPKYEF